MDKTEHVVTHNTNAPEKWPGTLKTAAEIADGLYVSAERLLELAETGYAPHYRVDGGPPLFVKEEIRSWIRTDLMFHNPGCPHPGKVNLTVHVHQKPAHDAPLAIADIPELLEFPLAAEPCVYFLVKGDVVVYVGQSTSPLGRIAQHVNNDQKDFDRVFAFPVPQDLLNQVEGALIRFLRPKLNGGKFPGRGPGDPEKDAGVIDTVFRQTRHLAVEGLSA